LGVCIDYIKTTIPFHNGARVTGHNVAPQRNQALRPKTRKTHPSQTNASPKQLTHGQHQEVEAEPGLSNKELFLTNHDLKPVEPERRQWKAFNFVGFWIADSFNINTWMIAASSLDASVGLSWWQAWICVWVGYTISAFFVVLTARIGAIYHISFPVVNRASFGIWGSLWPVLNRVVMAWYVGC